MRKAALLGLFITLVGLVLVFEVWALPPYPPPTIAANDVRVVDGDTIDVLITNITGTAPVSVGDTVRVRYIGMNTPETKHPCKPVEYFGKEASALNVSLVVSKTVYLELDAKIWDRDGRLLAYVYLDPQGYTMVNALLVAMGFAEGAAYHNVRYMKVFQELEDAAKKLKLGLWAPHEDSLLPVESERCFAWVSFQYQASKNGEYFTLQNTCDYAMDLTGWTVCDNSSHTFTFPWGFVLSPNCQVTIYTGVGINTDEKLYWGLESSVWNDAGDTATLRNAAREEVDSYSY